MSGHHRHTAGLGDGHGLTAQHGGHAEEILLVVGMKRRIMAARAFHLHPEKRLPYDLRLGRHWHIILRGHPKTTWAAVVLTAFHHDQLRNEPIHRLVVLQGFMNPEPERAGVVQLRLQNVWIFRQYILPIARPVVRPSELIIQEAINRLGAPVRALIFLELILRRFTWANSIGVKRCPPQKGVIIC